MNPSFSINNPAYYALSDGVFRGNLLLCEIFRRIQFFYAKHILIGNFRHLCKLANRMSASSYFFIAIIFMRSNIKVKWIHAFSEIARMAYNLKLRNFSICNLPRYTVGVLAFFRCLKLSVSSLKTSSSPFPAISKFGLIRMDCSVFINLLPKSVQLARCEVDRVFGFGKSLFSRIHNVSCEFLLAVSGAEYTGDGVSIFTFNQGGVK